MQHFKQPALPAITIAIFILCSVVQANEIESAFKKAGLVDVNTIDQTLIVDLVNSDPEKNYFCENYYPVFSFELAVYVCSVLQQNCRYLNWTVIDSKRQHVWRYVRISPFLQQVDDDI